MCGLAGILNFKNSPLLNLEMSLKVMNNLQKHRGPDGEGKWLHKSQKVGLSHVRLSIIDLNMGRQPMVSE